MVRQLSFGPTWAGQGRHFKTLHENKARRRDFCCRLSYRVASAPCCCALDIDARQKNPVKNWLNYLQKAAWPRNLSGSGLDESESPHATFDSAGQQASYCLLHPEIGSHTFEDWK
jgi:hypothetical protein